MDSQHLKELEKLLHRNQREMAELVGVAHVTYNRWHKGHAKPSRLARMRLAQIAANPEKFKLPLAMRPAVKHLTLAQARSQLKMNLFRIEQLRGRTPLKFIAQFRRDWIDPYEKLIEQLTSGRNKR